MLYEVITVVRQLTMISDSSYVTEEATVFGTPVADSKGNLYVAGEHEVYKVNGVGDYSLFLDTEEFGIHGFAFDKDDRIWFSGYEGIAFWNKTELLVYTSRNNFV